MGKLDIIASGLIGLGGGTLAVGKNQMEVNRELANALRAEVAAERSDERRNKYATTAADLANSRAVGAATTANERLVKHDETAVGAAKDAAGLISKAKKTEEENKLALEQEKADADKTYKEGLIKIGGEKNDIISQLNDLKSAKGSADKKTSDVERQKVINETITKANEFIDKEDVNSANAMLRGIGYVVQKFDKVPGKSGIFSNTPAVIGYRVVPTSPEKGLVESTAKAPVEGTGTQTASKPDEQRINSVLAMKPKGTAGGGLEEKTNAEKGFFAAGKTVNLDNPLSSAYAKAMERKDKYNEAKYGNLRKK